VSAVEDIVIAFPVPGFSCSGFCFARRLGGDLSLLHCAAKTKISCSGRAHRQRNMRQGIYGLAADPENHKKAYSAATIGEQGGEIQRYGNRLQNIPGYCVMENYPCHGGISPENAASDTSWVHSRTKTFTLRKFNPVIF
jgi:hypothetical protein